MAYVRPANPLRNAGRDQRQRPDAGLNRRPTTRSPSCRAKTALKRRCDLWPIHSRAGRSSIRPVRSTGRTPQLRADRLVEDRRQLGLARRNTLRDLVRGSGHDPQDATLGRLDAAGMARRQPTRRSGVAGVRWLDVDRHAAECFGSTSILKPRCPITVALSVRFDAGRYRGSWHQLFFDRQLFTSSHYARCLDQHRWWQAAGRLTSGAAAARALESQQLSQAPRLPGLRRLVSSLRHLPGHQRICQLYINGAASVGVVLWHCEHDRIYFDRRHRSAAGTLAAFWSVSLQRRPRRRPSDRPRLERRRSRRRLRPVPGRIARPPEPDLPGDVFRAERHNPHLRHRRFQHSPTPPP